MKQFYLYSAEENAFYPVSAPADAVQITDEQHRSLFVGQENGKAIKPNRAGYPINVTVGKAYEVWDREEETWIVDEELYQKYLEEERHRQLQQMHDDLNMIEQKIVRLERIKKRTELEEQELDQLIDESTKLYREIQKAEGEKA